jgi:probable HAF family extracellular repeat protein
MKKIALKILLVPICLASAPLLRAENVHAFLWSAKTGMQDLGTLGGTISYATAVNDHGTVVGYSFTAEGAEHAFLWTAETGMQDLGIPGDGFYNGSIARSINNRGEISGQLANSSGAEASFYWSATTGFIVLAQGLSEGQGMNDLGALTGTELKGPVVQAYLWYPSRGRLIGLGLLPGGIQSSGYDVNNLGNVAGYAVTGSGDIHAIYWNPTTGMLDLGVLSAGDFGEAMAINDNDEVVGESFQTTMGAAIYWSQSTGMVGLAALPGRVYTNAVGINNRGMIVGESGGEAVVWESYVSMPRALPTLPGGSFSFAQGLNNRGQVVGWADVP